MLDEDTTNIDTTNIEIDYGAVYGGIIDSVISSVSMNGGDVDYLTCSLYDMNNDGYKELIIENGACAADVVFEVYTISGKFPATFCTFFSTFLLSKKVFL